MLLKDYDRKGWVDKNSGRETQGAWRQNEAIGGKLPVVKYLQLWVQLRIDRWSSELVVEQSPAGNNVSTEAEDIFGICH
jgi:hypothetical protein